MNITTIVFCVVGGIVHYYDYRIYNFLAAQITQFYMAPGDYISQLSITYVIIAISYCAKPLGAILLGKSGDRHGRLATLIISIICVGIASLLIAVIPGYATIGVYATVILLCCRIIIVGFASSGTDGIRIFLYESIGKKNQNLAMSIMSGIAVFGAFCASLSSLYFTLNTSGANDWRYAFGIGAALNAAIIVAAYIFRNRFNFENNLIFEDKYQEYDVMPLSLILKKHLSLFLTVAITTGCISAVMMLHHDFLGTYFFSVLDLISQQQMRVITSMGMALFFCFAFMSGLLADQYGYRIVAYVGCILSVIFYTINIVLLIQYKTISIVAYVGGFCSLPMIVITSMCRVNGAIPKVIRYRIESLAHACGSIIIAGTAPLCATQMYKATLISCLPLIYCGILVIILGFVITHWFKNDLFIK